MAFSKSLARRTVPFGTKGGLRKTDSGWSITDWTYQGSLFFYAVGVAGLILAVIALFMGAKPSLATGYGREIVVLYFPGIPLVVLCFILGTRSVSLGSQLRFDGSNIEIRRLGLKGRRTVAKETADSVRLFLHEVDGALTPRGQVKWRGWAVSARVNGHEFILAVQRGRDEVVRDVLSGPEPLSTVEIESGQLIQGRVFR